MLRAQNQLISDAMKKFPRLALSTKEMGAVTKGEVDQEYHRLYFYDPKAKTKIHDMIFILHVTTHSPVIKQH